LLAEYKASERRVCELMQIPRSTCRYRSRRDDTDLREQLLHLAREHPRFGYRRLHVLLRRECGRGQPTSGCSVCTARWG